MEFVVTGESKEYPEPRTQREEYLSCCIGPDLKCRGMKTLKSDYRRTDNTDNSTDESTDDSTDESADESAEESTDESADESTGRER